MRATKDAFLFDVKISTVDVDTREPLTPCYENEKPDANSDTMLVPNNLLAAVRFSNGSDMVMHLKGAASQPLSLMIGSDGYEQAEVQIGPETKATMVVPLRKAVRVDAAR